MLLTLLLLTVNAAAWDKIAGSSLVDEPRELHIANPRQWEKLWREHKGDDKTPAPEVDFDSEMVVAIFLGKRPTGGYTIEVSTRPDPLDPNRLVVFYKEVPPQGLTTTMVSRPFIMVKARTYPHVAFEADVPLRALPREKRRGGLTVEALEGLNRRFEELKRFSFPR